jgi:hypothetical protein
VLVLTRVPIPLSRQFAQFLDKFGDFLANTLIPDNPPPIARAPPIVHPTAATRRAAAAGNARPPLQRGQSSQVRHHDKSALNKW